jgi:Spy/CpxP family protein refolding chaperone
MICLALGLGVLGFFAARKARRCARGSYGYGWHHHHHHGWHHGHHRGGPGRRGLYMALSHIDASPAQERAIISEVDKLHERLHTAKRGLKDGRVDLAAALRGPVLDDAALGAVLGRIDGATVEARSAALEALRNIHAVLDDKQREHVAELLEKGWWGARAWRGPGGSGGGPYRV